MDKINKNEFEKIVKDTYKMIYNLGLRLFNYDVHEAEDFTQEVYLQLYKNINKYDGKSKITTWIYSLALNLGLNKIKKKKRFKKIQNPDPVYEADLVSYTNPETDYLEKLDDKILIEKVQKELMNLPEEYRIPLILLFYEKLSYKEMSEKLNIPEGTLKSLVYRGKLKLREKIKELKDIL
ncbi:MAG: DNA-directed RNA polymerase sigma-70 factor [Leptospiraceae bacterium]|nr:MAG: DNA-directed RNA polymerase sigma-70 factor [Leptospiraceae bacterium]